MPSVVVLPLGFKPNGSPYGKSDMVVISPEVARANQVLSRDQAPRAVLRLILVVASAGPAGSPPPAVSKRRRLWHPVLPLW